MSKQFASASFAAIPPRKVVLMLALLLQTAIAVLAARAYPSAWAVEYNSTLPSAVSYAFHNAPIGAIDRNVLVLFNDFVNAGGRTHASVRRAVEQTGYGNIPPGEIIATTTDGIGAGQPMFLGIAFKLFGARLTSPLYLFLLLMAMSAGAFLARFNDETLLAALPIYVALSIISVTPVALEQWVVDGTPVGGNRYFAVLGIVPAIHIFYEIIENGDGRRQLGFFLVGIQAILLMLAILVRSSAAYLLGLIGLAVFLRLRATKGNRAERKLLYRKTGWIAIVGVTTTCLALAMVPNYVASGRAFGNFWHRAFTSLAAHPQFPFGNLRQVHDCTKFIPEGLNRENWDRNGHCVWWLHVIKQGWSEEEVNKRGVYDGEYELVARDAWLDVIWSYPKQSLEVYFIYKPLRILRTLKEATAIDLRRSPTEISILVLAQVMLFLGYVGYCAARGSREISARAGIILFLFLLSLPSQLVAWSSLETGIDSIVYMYATFVLAAACAMHWAITGARRFRPGRSCLEPLANSKTHDS